MSIKRKSYAAFAALAGAALILGLGAPLRAQLYPEPSQAVHGAPLNATTVNGSATITTGNTFQTVLPALPLSGPNWRRSLTINNNNTSDSCWIFLGSGAATKGTSILLTAGQTYRRDWPYVPADAVQATCVTSNDTLYIDTQ